MVCDQLEKYEILKKIYKGQYSLLLCLTRVFETCIDVPGIMVLRDGHQVSRTSDFIIYSVEAEFIDSVVAKYGPCMSLIHPSRSLSLANTFFGPPATKVGAIVAGQTSVKAPEKEAFEKYLPTDVHIVSCHSLHGPTVSPLGQPLVRPHPSFQRMSILNFTLQVLIRHRAPEECLTLVENILRPFGSRYVYLSYRDHDTLTANTQAVTHAAFLSMGTAWSHSTTYPWEHGYYVGGIETVKVNIMLRIYSNKWHVYAGLAILNPEAGRMIEEFAGSVTDLFKLMLGGDERGLRERVWKAREKVFGFKAEGEENDEGTRPIFLSEDILDRFSLGSPSQDQTPKSNSHLSLLAMVDCWSALSIQPMHHLSLAATPIFRLWIGVAEYLFRSPARLNAAIDAACRDSRYRSDDLEFVVAARGWSQCVSFGNFELYRKRFESTRAFFESRFEEAEALGSAMIRAIMEEQ